MQLRQRHGAPGRAVPRAREQLELTLRARGDGGARRDRLARSDSAFSRLLWRTQPSAARLSFGRPCRGWRDLNAIRVRIGGDIQLYAAGVSLGGSALLNWLGRAGSGASATLRRRRRGVGAIDLTAAGEAIGRGLNIIYTWYFLATLKPKGHTLARRFPGLLDEWRIARVRSMYDSTRS